MTTELKEGTDTDREVAIALGCNPVLINREWLCQCEEYSHGSMEWGGSLCNYSTDLNDAFQAAEKAFGCGFALHTAGKTIGGWKTFRCIVGIGWDGFRCAEQIETTAPTPALAICKAILSTNSSSSMPPDAILTRHNSYGINTR